MEGLMVGHSSITFWVAVCVAIVIYCEDDKFVRNNISVECIWKKEVKVNRQNSRASEMLMTKEMVDPGSSRQAIPPWLGMPLHRKAGVWKQ
jgi:hypothetical protein